MYTTVKMIFHSSFEDLIIYFVPAMLQVLKMPILQEIMPLSLTGSVPSRPHMPSTPETL